MSPVNPVVDYVGNQITPNCVVCYPVRRGSELWLNRITVTQVTETKVSGYNPTGRVVHLTNLQNLIVVNVPKVN